MTKPIRYRSDGEAIEGLEPIVILGPNGSGKSRYGLQLAEWNTAETIAALRNIALPTQIPMQSVAQAAQELTNHGNQRKRQPWGISSEINILFAKLIAEDAESAIEFREKYSSGETEPETTKLMRLQTAWEELFPGRHIEFKGYNPKVTSEYVAGETSYSAQSMSDGERVALYLAGRVLDAAPGIIIIDEPEVHFHSRLAIRFWDHLEKLRPDCRFVYITHDLTFSRSRDTDHFIIVRPNREPELVSIGDGMPPEIAQEILSAASFSIYANQLIFCEGTESSYDRKLLQAWFNERTNAVIPVGSCSDVVKCTSAFRESSFLSGVTAIGLIDRDYWPDLYLESLPNGVSTIPAHEIESFLCFKSIFVAIAQHLGLQVGESETLHTEFLAEAAARFTEGLLWKQVSERFRTRCKEQMDRSVNGLRVEGDEALVKSSHCSAVDPVSWTISPSDIFDGGEGQD